MQSRIIESGVSHRIPLVSDNLVDHRHRLRRRGDRQSPPVEVDKDIVLTVQPMQQSDLDAAFAFMKKVCTEDVYWEGIRSANEQNGNNAVELLVIESALIAGFSKILAEKLIRLCGADAEDVLAAEQTPPQP